MHKANIGKMWCFCYVFPEGRIFNRAHPDSYPEGWGDLDTLTERLVDSYSAAHDFTNLTSRNKRHGTPQLDKRIRHNANRRSIFVVENHRFNLNNNECVHRRSCSVRVVASGTITVTDK